MINPFSSEARAFRFLLGVLASCLAIAVAAGVGGFWPGLIVCVVLTAAVAWWWLAAGRAERPPRMRPPPHPPGKRRILVIANETVGGQSLRRLLAQRTRAPASAELLVVTPALNSPLRHWASDEDGARAAAQQRLDASLERLRALGIQARGEVGDADPLQAIEDGLRRFGADEIILSTHPPGRSNWLERHIVERARDRFAVPLTHVVVDLEHERERDRDPVHSRHPNAA